MNRHLLLVLCLALGGIVRGVAQPLAAGDCAQRLQDAQVAFSKGELQSALTLIEACALSADEVYTKEEALQAQTLLATLYEGAASWMGRY